MREMPLPCHNHIVVLKRVNPPGSLIATLVRPLVQLLRKIDETNRRRHPQQYIGIINDYNARHCNRKCCLAYLVDIITHLPVRDGPREFVMPLKGFYLRPEYGRVLGAIIIHWPVIHSRAQIRKLVPNLYIWMRHVTYVYIVVYLWVFVSVCLDDCMFWMYVHLHVCMFTRICICQRACARCVGLFVCMQAII